MGLNRLFTGRMDNQNSIHLHLPWSDEEVMNGYAVFMGYLLKGVRGLGLVLVTWTTAILLGGFVSSLSREDFGCLVAITLVQIFGVFDFRLKEKLRDAKASYKGLIGSMFYVMHTHPTIPGKIQLAYIISVIQIVIIPILLLPLGVLYIFGFCISMALSLWRLIHRDYVKGSPNMMLPLNVTANMAPALDATANMKPTLIALYSLALAQGALFGYRALYVYCVSRRLMKTMTDGNSKDQKNLVSDYIDYIVSGCEKDLSFARGKSVITYVVDLMTESKSSNTFISGLRNLGSLLEQEVPESGTSAPLSKENTETKLRILKGRVVMKQRLTGSASFGRVIQKLLDILGPRNPYSAEIRGHAARIVTLVAGSILLEQFPRGIQCISCLFDTQEEYIRQPRGYERDRSLLKEYDRDWLLEEDERSYLLSSPERQDEAVAPVSDTIVYKKMVVQGLRILQKLTVHEDNCRFINSTGNLLSKILAPLTSDEAHKDYHDEWCSMQAEESLGLISRLMADPGETAGRLRDEIVRNSDTIITTIKYILSCRDCKVLIKRKAVQLLLEHPSADTHFTAITASLRTDESIREIFTWMLVHTFLLSDCHFERMPGSVHWFRRRSHTNYSAGERLRAMLSSESAPAVVGVVVDDLTRRIKETGNNAYIFLAARILEHLCLHYTRNDEYLDTLKGSMIAVMDEVLHIIRNETKRPAASGTDVEQGVISTGNGHRNASSSHQQNQAQSEGTEKLEALTSLCKTIQNAWVRQDQARDEFNSSLDSKCERLGKSFAELLDEASEVLVRRKA